VSKSIPVSEVSYDKSKWTEKRCLDSSMHRAEDYYGGLVKEMYKRYGVEGCQANNDQMMEMARKYVPRALKNFHIVGNDCRTVAAYFKLVDKIVFNTDFEVLEDTPRRVVLRGSSGCPLSAHPQDELCVDMCENGMGHETIACQIVNPALTFHNLKLMSAGDDSCDLCFELPESAPLADVSVPVSLYKLDETVWTKERREKARQRRDWENFGSMVKAIYKKFGQKGLQVVYDITSQSSEKYIFVALKNHHIKGNDARTFGGYYKIFHKMIYGNDLDIIEDTPKRVVMRNSGFCPLSPEPKKDLKPEICASVMGHEHAASKFINPKLKFSVPEMRSAGAPYCEYVIEL
jgi:hypothetical protein